MHKIPLVEDDKYHPPTVKQLLEQWGYEVVAVEIYGCSRIFRNRPPLDPRGYWTASLQWLPLVPGDSQGFKGSDHVSSSRDQAMDIVMAINMGGDDFLSPSP